ncbi:MAG: DUF3299 domain-containing protein [Pseudomonadota bacterium]
MKISLILIAFFMLSAFSVQPSDERKAQETLPISKSPIWQILQKTKIKADQKSGYFSAVHAKEVKDFVGKEITISGFMLPLESKDKFKHFLLTKRTPTCPFCPPGEPNEIIDVLTTKPVSYSDESITVKGKFELMNDKDMGLFFRLRDANIGNN